MTLNELKSSLQKIEQVNFSLPNGEIIPSHFHITEVGLVSKSFIDCGGTIRKENLISFQLWYSEDTEHRLVPEKLLSIISKAEKSINLDNYEVEFEYQLESINKFAISFSNSIFQLVNKHTACLASGSCGTPDSSIKNNNSMAKCSPGGGCC